MIAVDDSKSLIIGADGQDGKVLQEILSQRSQKYILQNRSSIRDSLGNIKSATSAEEIESIFKYQEISKVYFFAAEHSPALANYDSNGIAQLHKQLDLISDALIVVLESIRRFSPTTKIFFSSSVLIFGTPSESPQSELCPPRPNETYGLFKKISQDIVSFYRENHNIFASSGILFPHESHYRGDNFLFKQIVNFVNSISNGSGEKLAISDLSFTREWNCAFQVMESIIRILDLEKPQDFVVGSGRQSSIEETCRLAFEVKGLDYRDFVIESGERLISRSPNLVADVRKLQTLVGYSPDGDVASLIERTFKKLGK